MTKILIADDEKPIRDIIKTTLKGFGECTTVKNGEEAIIAVDYADNKKKSFDLVILDIKMDKINGIDVLQQIRKKEIDKSEDEKVKIIMISGNSDAEIVKKCITEGCNKFIVKPIEPSVLIKYTKELNFKFKKVTW